MGKTKQDLIDEPQGQIAYQRLLDDIRSGGLPPGARLREIELSERLAISRTPVREALRRLEADGLVVHVPRLGAVVKELTYQEVMELYEMRVVLEGTAARLAARHASELEIEELDALNQEMKAHAGDAAALYRINRLLHAALLNAAKNRYLIKSMQALSRTLLILGPTTLSGEERAAAAFGEHAQVIEAIGGRQQDRAEQLMRAHVEAALRARLRVLHQVNRLMEDEPSA